MKLLTQLLVTILVGCSATEVPDNTDFGFCTGIKGVLETAPGIPSCEDNATRARACREAGLHDTYAVEAGCDRPVRRSGVDRDGKCLMRDRGTEGCQELGNILCCPQY